MCIMNNKGSFDLNLFLQTLQVSKCSQTFLYCVKFTIRLPQLRRFLPDAAMSKQKTCMIARATLQNVNTRQARLGRNGCLNGGNEGLSDADLVHWMDRGQALGRLGEAILGRGVSRRLWLSRSVIRRLQGRFRATGSAEE